MLDIPTLVVCTCIFRTAGAQFFVLQDSLQIFRDFVAMKLQRSCDIFVVLILRQNTESYRVAK